ncbi:hypothetical protein ASG11_13520 [Sphingomonas sp. Leaf357]|uniref:hypothetical protein n=1 Tax=Sphingomonas sp. Leaf357 TaxID=1736350 RepID=UPI0006F900F8|nr:hypothetical protein [Sphingomonas sp. Leaf357]KQS01843.1 hypothetical protein ASG11_13520 [Sphingomonas sp. Leaf357]
MIVVPLLLSLAQATPPPPVPEDATDEIVVTAIDRSEKCRIRFADRDMNDAELKRRSVEWAAGKPLRVVARASTDLKCLSKIAFRLADRGVTRIHFVEPKDLGPAPTPTPTPTTTTPAR